MCSVQKRIERFHERCPGRHFTVYYNLRNPRDQPGNGGGGVADDLLARHYLYWCEATHTYMSTRGWRPLTDLWWKGGPEGETFPIFLENPIQPGGLRVPIFVPEGPDSFICLPCRHWEPTEEAAMNKAGAQAVHETAHLLNSATRWPGLVHLSPEWGSANEMTAMFMEFQVPRFVEGDKRNLTYLEHAMAWVEHADLSLVELNPRSYSSSAFLRSLVHDHGFDTIARWWTSSPQLDPLSALSSALGNDVDLFDPAPAPGRVDPFGRYCVEAFLMRHFDDVRQRFGGRSLRESFDLSNGSAKALSRMRRRYRVDNFGFRYFRLFLSPHAERVTITVFSPSGPLSNFDGLRAALMLFDDRGELVGEAIPADGGRGGEFQTLETSLLVDGRRVHHVVLAVYKCTKAFLSHSYFGLRYELR